MGALRAYADKNGLNIMALNTAITGREVIGFTNQPWLWVFIGTGLHWSYFTDCWAVCQRQGLMVTRNWCWSIFLEALEKLEKKIHKTGWLLKSVYPCLLNIIALGERNQSLFVLFGEIVPFMVFVFYKYLLSVWG